MAASTKSLVVRDLIDLAISTADPGAVNFNVLRKLLEVILKETNLHNKTLPDFVLPDSLLSPPSTSLSPLNCNLITERLAKLEETVQNIVGLPSNKDLIENGSGPRCSGRPVADLYQSIKVASRIEALENAVAKLASLVDDLIQRDCTITEAVEHAEVEVRELTKTVSSFGLPDVVNSNSELVTWEGLYQAFEGSTGSIPQDTKRKKSSEETEAEPVAAKKKRKSTRVTDVKSAQTDKPVTATDSSTARINLTPILRDLRHLQEQLDARYAELLALIHTKADKRDVDARFNQMASDLTVAASRTEQAFSEIRALRGELDELSRAFEEYSATRRVNIRRSTAPAVEVKRAPSQGCVVFPKCPPTPDPTSTQPVLASSLVKIHDTRLDSLDDQLEIIRKRFEQLQSFLNTQVISLTDRQNTLEEDISDVIKMFKERRRPNMQCGLLDMNIVEKMLDDYEQIIEEMRQYDAFGKEIGKKTDRLTYLCDDLKRNKADARTVRDALEMKADNDDLHEKANKSSLEEHVRSSQLQIESLTRQLQCNESVIRNELARFLDSLSTRASHNSMEDLRSLVTELTQTMMREGVTARTVSKKTAAATNCNVQCLSCGDEVYQETKQEATMFPAFPQRDTVAPFAAYGRSVVGEGAPCRPTSRNQPLQPNYTRNIRSKAPRGCPNLEQINQAETRYRQRWMPETEANRTNSLETLVKRACGGADARLAPNSRPPSLTATGVAVLSPVSVIPKPCGLAKKPFRSTKKGRVLR